MSKYTNNEKKMEFEAKKAAVFEANIEDMDAVSASTSVSSSEFLDSECKELFFTVEEIDQLSEADKYIYMNKLQNDYDDLKDKIDNAIAQVDTSIADCQDSIARGEETLAAFKDYQDRMTGLGKDLTKNMGYIKKRDDRKGRTQRDWLRPNQRERRVGSINSTSRTRR